MKYGIGFGFTHLGRIGRIGAKACLADRSVPR